MLAPHGKMIRIRGAQALNRLTSDIDALDGVPLRLVLPLMAGVVTHLLAFVSLWALAGFPIAAWIMLSNSVGGALLFWYSARKSAPLSRQAEAAGQAFRSRFIDLIRGRRDLAVLRQLTTQAAAIRDADDRKLALRRQQDRESRLVGGGLLMLNSVVAGGTLFLGIVQVQHGQITPAFAALGFFAALALAETMAPLRRAASDLGRVLEAARRVSRDLTPTAPVLSKSSAAAGPLQVDAVALQRPQSDTLIFDGLSFQLSAGETVALTGESGAGKSTLLLAVAGLHPVAKGRISLGGLAIADWDEAALRGIVTLLPQRSALMAGTVAEALRLGAPQANDAALQQVLDIVQLSQTLAARGGLEARIGPRGEGFSGGEARRLAFARALLRHPKLLLLDEPTEGLDEVTAKAVLHAIRRYLPDAAILIAAHRAVETRFADRLITIN
jgi:ATP-binding cassette subfamily C protein CydC